MNIFEFNLVFYLQSFKHNLYFPNEENEVTSGFTILIDKLLKKFLVGLVQ